MVFLHLSYQLPAAFGLAASLRPLLPWELDDRLSGLFLVLCCLAALYLPLTVTLALALSPVVGMLFRITGTALRGHEPFIYPQVSVPGFLGRFSRRTEYVYQADHISGDLDELAQDAEEPVEEDPPARSRKYVPDI